MGCFGTSNPTLEFNRMPTSIDLSKLSLMDALDLAILIEEEACQRYKLFASQVGGGSGYDAGSFFASMADNEAKHGNELLARRIALFGKKPMNVKLVDLFDVEAPDISAPRRGMSTLQAFELGLASEKKAYDFFDGALAGITDPEVRTLFTELRDEETKKRPTTSSTAPWPASPIPKSGHCSPNFGMKRPNTSRCSKRQWPNYPRAPASRPKTTPMMPPIYRA
jgi:rubrerythrin